MREREGPAPQAWEVRAETHNARHDRHNQRHPGPDAAAARSGSCSQAATRRRLGF